MPKEYPGLDPGLHYAVTFAAWGPRPPYISQLFLDRSAHQCRDTLLSQPSFISFSSWCKYLLYECLIFLRSKNNLRIFVHSTPLKFFFAPTMNWLILNSSKQGCGWSWPRSGYDLLGKTESGFDLSSTPFSFRYKGQYNYNWFQESVADPGEVDPDPTLKKTPGSNWIRVRNPTSNCSFIGIYSRKLTMTGSRNNL